jgi:hypothetical protein
MVWMGMLYDIEREVREKELSYEETREPRQENAPAILDEFGKWLIDQTPVVLPKSAIGIVINSY